MKKITQFLIIFYHFLILTLIPITIFNIFQKSSVKSFSDKKQDLEVRYNTIANSSWTDTENLYTLQQDALFQKSAREKGKFYLEYCHIDWMFESYLEETPTEKTDDRSKP